MSEQGQQSTKSMFLLLLGRILLPLCSWKIWNNSNVLLFLILLNNWCVLYSAFALVKFKDAKWKWMQPNSFFLPHTQKNHEFDIPPSHVFPHILRATARIQDQGDIRNEITLEMLLFTSWYLRQSGSNIFLNTSTNTAFTLTFGMPRYARNFVVLKWINPMRFSILPTGKPKLQTALV